MFGRRAERAASWSESRHRAASGRAGRARIKKDSLDRHAICGSDTMVKHHCPYDKGDLTTSKPASTEPRQSSKKTHGLVVNTHGKYGRGWNYSLIICGATRNGEHDDPQTTGRSSQANMARWSCVCKSPCYFLGQRVVMTTFLQALRERPGGHRKAYRTATRWFKKKQHWRAMANGAMLHDKPMQQYTVPPLNPKRRIRA